MTVIPLRLRVPLELRTREERLLEAATGIRVPPTRVPARTTLRVVDVFQSGAPALLPDGRRLLLPHGLIESHGYLPRGRSRSGSGGS